MYVCVWVLNEWYFCWQELLEFRQGKRLVDADGADIKNDVDKENELLLIDNDNLRRRIHALQATIEQLTENNCKIKASMEMNAINSKIKMVNGLKKKSGSKKRIAVGQEEEDHDGDDEADVQKSPNNDDHDHTLARATDGDDVDGIDGGGGDDDDDDDEQVKATESIILKYIRETERLRAQLHESENLCKQVCHPIPFCFVFWFLKKSLKFLVDSWQKHFNSIPTISTTSKKCSKLAPSSICCPFGFVL